MKSQLIDGHTHVGVDVLFYLRGHYPYALDWLALVEKGQACGVGRFVVFPMVSHLALDLGEESQGRILTGVERVPYAFENRRLMTELGHFPEYQDRALPLWMIDPSREQQAQVEALRRLKAEFRCCGLKIQATVIKSFISDLLGAGQCLLELAEESNWPILIHTSVHPEDPWSRIEDILAVVKKHPELRFCLAHSCRFDAPSLDEVAALPNAWFDCSAHRIHCKLAVENHPAIADGSRRMSADYRDPALVMQKLAERYPDKFIWGSDAPFESYVDEDIQLRSSYREEVEILHQLDPALIQRVAHINTMEFLKL